MAEIGRERGKASPVGDLAGSAAKNEFLMRTCARIARGFGGLAVETRARRARVRRDTESGSSRPADRSTKLRSCVDCRAIALVLLPLRLSSVSASTRPQRMKARRTAAAKWSRSMYGSPPPGLMAAVAPSVWNPAWQSSRDPCLLGSHGDTNC